MTDLLKKHAGLSVILFTTDGALDSMVKCGSTPNTYATVDFGPGDNPAAYFAIQRKFQKHGPFVCVFSFYTRNIVNTEK